MNDIINFLKEGIVLACMVALIIEFYFIAMMFV
ncbi:hypothetical protein UFOVP1082_29 [uncultured Caudovirales phage]|uniref:Uncharacterized protein n=1 Tax=uncultured Caudovirales phage TaxID=2100421 RepID=A0A6J5SF80_9CAUD|nr:hypothetical protein UFOVP906_7 [uncultured Caudovirales phage]CAB4176458.1 hypothetical protein UFOVP992_33 [uncultured Caudovirales phage]CAB4183314.1 hypothetical protein UFOVP1082_29 [uncultured Caudovirales phage]CAB4197298.1 hypothetical protein UFOVP1322_14 [uncultured Caudovirales phage]CAB4212689.1 hypothetical protein UFOVP1434_36 [uncultured Caudovirales phage]